MRLPPALLALTPGDLFGARADLFLPLARTALGAGLPGILLREPQLEEREFLELARKLRQVCSLSGAWFGVHDRAHMAQLVAADGLQLGWRSLPPRAARKVVGAELALGRSTHAPDLESERLVSLQLDALDFVVHGPVHATPSKAALTESAPVVGLEGLHRACRALSKPVWAIGGLGPEHVRESFAQGAAGVAVLSGIFGHGDPAQAVRSYLSALPAQ